MNSSTLPLPFYEDDFVTLYHGDAYELVERIEGFPARLISDPPYGTAAYEHDRSVDLEALALWIRGFSTVAIFGYPETLAWICATLQVGPSEWVTWWPTNKPMARARLLPRESEHIAIFGEVVGADRLTRPRSDDEMTRRIAESRGNDVDSCRLGDVWRDPSPGAGFNRHLRLHMNQNPLSALERLVLLCSHQNDLVVDPFAGSGTTLVAAKKLGRRAIGIEIDQQHCQTAAERCAQEVLFGEAA